MYEERSRHDWQQTASVMALLYNINRGKNDLPRGAEDFDPWERRDAARRPALDDGGAAVDRMVRQWTRNGPAGNERR